MPFRSSSSSNADRFQDWHLVEDERVKGTSGWTGYSWNRKLIPDPPAFLSKLHGKGLKVTPNLHPADGIHAYEDAYQDLAKALGHDTCNDDPIVFDATNRAFIDAYFDVLHRKLEDDGIDFWWVDWQQGEYSRVPGVDPLWVLNHFHFLDNGRDGTRPLTFSRYAGPGSHRYPVGFSGDTIVTWESLDFQPEFTATSSNIGYGWWSHDIGGHMGGYRDDELAARWVQFGCFSPILRLHSSNNPFNTKEPWNYREESRTAMNKSLRLRHLLTPYIYTMNVRSAEQNEPLIQPMYWEYPERTEAYRARNQFFFGSELIVAPITTPRDSVTWRGKVRAWLPPGRYVDIMTGAVYNGDREMWMYRDLDRLPVLAREGAIIPMDAANVPRNGGHNPEAFNIVIVVGADGTFDIVEDDGSSTNIKHTEFSRTTIAFGQGAGKIITRPTTSRIVGIPSSRKWQFSFPGMAERENTVVKVDDKPRSAGLETSAGGFLVIIDSVPTDSTITVELGPNPQLAITNAAEHVYPILRDAHMDYNLKNRIWAAVTGKVPLNARISQLSALDMDQNLFDAVMEYFLADSRS